MNPRFELILLHTCNHLHTRQYELEALLESGAETLHLRPGGLNYADFRQFILLLPAKALSRIVIHGCYALATELSLKGIHLTEAARAHGNWKALTGAQFKGTTSASIHQLRDLAVLPMPLDYVFFSPVFPSISKSGHIPHLLPGEIRALLQGSGTPVPVMALGGIDEHSILTAQSMGFQGAVLHGALLQQEAPWKVVERIRALLA